MKRFYSKETGTTYLQGLHTDIPQDAVAIDEARYQTVIANPDPGKIRSHDAEGLPVLIDSQEVSREQQLLGAFERQMRLIDTSSENAIAAGFASYALGNALFYNSQPADQRQLAGAVALGEPMPLVCRDDVGVRQLRLHTGQALRQVAHDFASYKLQLLQRAAELKQRLTEALTAQDLKAIQAITWEPPV